MAYARKKDAPPNNPKHVKHDKQKAIKKSFKKKVTKHKRNRHVKKPRELKLSNYKEIGTFLRNALN